MRLPNGAEKVRRRGKGKKEGYTSSDNEIRGKTGGLTEETQFTFGSWLLIQNVVTRTTEKKTGRERG